MDYLAIAWTRFGHLNVNVFLEVRWDLEILVLVGSGRLERKLVGHLQYHVRLTYCPAVHKLGGRWQILGITFLRSLIDPCCDSLDLALTQTAIVRELSIVRVRMPRWHLFGGHLLFDRAGPWSRILVAQKRHGRGFAWSMTLGAVLKEDRRDVSRKGYFFLCTRIRAAGGSQSERE